MSGPLLVNAGIHKPYTIVCGSWHAERAPISIKLFKLIESRNSDVNGGVKIGHSFLVYHFSCCPKLPDYLIRSDLLGRVATYGRKPTFAAVTIYRRQASKADIVITSFGLT